MISLSAEPGERSTMESGWALHNGTEMAMTMLRPTPVGNFERLNITISTFEHLSVKKTVTIAPVEPI